MSAVAWAEFRQLVRSPVLWMGLALAAGAVWLLQGGDWPVLAGDDHTLYRASSVLYAAAVLAGAWAGLRDHLSGVGDVIGVVPTSPQRRWLARLAGVAGVCVVFVALLFSAGLAVSALRGGRGVPDARLLADAALAVTLSAWAGVAIGQISRSRLAALALGPVWVGVAVFLSATTRGWPFARLSPVLANESRSAVLGFLPDPFWGHLAYLAGLVVLAGVVVVLAARVGSAPRAVSVPLAAVALVAATVSALSGVWLLRLPEGLVVRGSDPGAWQPVEIADFFAALDPAAGVTAAGDGDAPLEEGEGADDAGDPDELVALEQELAAAESLPESPRSLLPSVEDLYLVLLAGERLYRGNGNGVDAFLDSDGADSGWRGDDYATTCVMGRAVEVCVYPSYGEGLARVLLGEVDPVAVLLDGLPGVPDRLRVVPATGEPCQPGEVQIDEASARVRDWEWSRYEFTGCALFGESHATPTEDPDVEWVLTDWVLSTADDSYREELRAGYGLDGSAAEVKDPEGWTRYEQVLRALLALPPDHVRAELEPLWERLHEGTVTLDELAGAVVAE